MLKQTKRKKADKSTWFINEATEEHLAKYRETLDENYFREHLWPPLEKMVAGVINNYNKNVTLEPYILDECKSEGIAAGHRAMLKFDLSCKGKLFAYVGVSIKHAVLGYWKKTKIGTNKITSTISDKEWIAVEAHHVIHAPEHHEDDSQREYAFFWKCMINTVSAGRKKLLYMTMSSLPVSVLEDKPFHSMNLIQFVREHLDVLSFYDTDPSGIIQVVRKDAKKVLASDAWKTFQKMGIDGM